VDKVTHEKKMDDEKMDHSIPVLDTSWIEQEEQLHSSEIELPKRNMESILCHFIYISSDRSIQKIVKERESLSSMNDRGDFGISSSRMLQMIQTRRYLGNGLKYKIMGLLKFFVDLDADSLYEYSYGEKSEDMSQGFFQEITFLEGVGIKPSLFIFHSLNSLYFIFKEDENVKKNVKSILKTASLKPSSETSSRSTKKVRISDEVIPENTHSLVKTLKHKSKFLRKTRKQFVHEV